MEQIPTPLTRMANLLSPSPPIGGHYYAVIALLAAGADVNQPGEDGLNALEVAIAQDFPQVASVLYNVGGQRTDRLDKYLAMVEEALCSPK